MITMSEVHHLHDDERQHVVCLHLVRESIVVCEEIQALNNRHDIVRCERMQLMPLAVETQS